MQENNEKIYIQETMKKKSHEGALGLIDFKTHYKASVIKMVLYWYMNKWREQQKGIGSPEIDPSTYRNLVYNKDGISSS